MSIPDEWTALHLLSALTTERLELSAERWRLAFPLAAGVVDPLQARFEERARRPAEWELRKSQRDAERAEDETRRAAKRVRCAPTAVVLWRYRGQTVGVGHSEESARHECLRHMREDLKVDDCRPNFLGEALVVDRGTAEATYDAVMGEFGTDASWAATVRRVLEPPAPPAVTKPGSALRMLRRWVEFGTRDALEDGATLEDIEAAIRRGREAVAVAEQPAIHPYQEVGVEAAAAK